MQITVNIPDELAAELESRLASEAAARGLSLDSYLLEKLVGTLPSNGGGRRTVDEAIDGIRELRKGNRLAGLRIKDLIEEGRRY
jgi:hypothetical protein